MKMTYRVGYVTQYGKLVAESLKWDMPTQVVSLYETDGESPYMLILWEISDISAEFEICRIFHDSDDLATESFVKLSFGM